MFRKTKDYFRVNAAPKNSNSDSKFRGEILKSGLKGYNKILEAHCTVLELSDCTGVDNGASLPTGWRIRRRERQRSG